MEWRLGLPAWIVQDGNYTDVRRGDRVEAAVEIAFTQPPQIVEATTPSARHVDDTTYDVVGRLLVIEADATVIDIGISVYCETAPLKGASVGDFVAGRVYLGFDPFTYLEQLAKRASVPPLIYTWQVLDVARENAEGASTAIDHTDVWHDDDGHADYTLRCVLLDEPPKRVRVAELGVTTP